MELKDLKKSQLIELVELAQEDIKHKNSILIYLKLEIETGVIDIKNSVALWWLLCQELTNDGII